MRKKITWRMIYTDFKKQFPKESKLVTYWRPYDYATIQLYFKKGNIRTYNYDTKQLSEVLGSWLHKDERR